MSLNDDYFDVLHRLNSLRKNRKDTLASFLRLIKRLDDLEEENEKLRNILRNSISVKNELTDQFISDLKKLGE